MEDAKANTYADEWDAGDMGCGELLIHLSMKMKQLQPGELFKLIALDPGAVEDMPAWCRLTPPYPGRRGPSCVRDAPQRKLTI
jgi:tRNA 2-thiouridine synthesizing protein A